MIPADPLGVKSILTFMKNMIYVDTERIKNHLNRAAAAAEDRHTNMDFIDAFLKIAGNSKGSKTC